MGILRRLLGGDANGERTPIGNPIYRHEGPEVLPRIGFSQAPHAWAQAREAHYRQWLGPSDLVWHEAIPLIPHIDVWVRPPAPERGRNYYTLVTSGMSDERMHVPPELPQPLLARAELMLYVPADWAPPQPNQLEKPWYVSLLTYFAHFPWQYKTWLGFGHTVPNGDPPAPIAEGSSLTTAFLLSSIYEPPEFHAGLKLDGEPVNLLWLTFITNDECELKLKRGFDALTARFSDQAFPQVLDLHRPSVLSAR